MYQTFYESGYVCLEGSNKLEHVKQIVETTLLLTAFTGTAAFNIYILVVAKSTMRYLLTSTCQFHMNH